MSIFYITKQMSENIGVINKCIICHRKDHTILTCEKCMICDSNLHYTHSCEVSLKNNKDLLELILKYISEKKYQYICSVMKTEKYLVNMYTIIKKNIRC